MKKILFFVGIFLTSLALSLNVSAEDRSFSDEYRQFTDAVPGDVADRLPVDFFSDDGEKIANAVSYMSSISYIVGEVLYAFGFALRERLPTLVTLLCIVILSSVANAVSVGLGGGKILANCSRLCIVALSVSGATSSLGKISAYFSSLSGLSASFVPLSGALYAMGGNVSAAAASTSTLSFTLSVCEFISSYTVMPFFCICLVFTLLSSFDTGLDMSTVLSSLKKNYTLVLGLIMTFISGSLVAQTVISSRADGAAMRGVKFVAGSFIPVTGGTVASGMSTLAAGVSLLRGTVGIGGIIVIFVMLLPTIAELITIKIVYNTAAFFAGVCGCAPEQKVLSEIGSLYGYLEGVAVLCSSAIVISMAVLAFCTCAVA